MKTLALLLIAASAYGQCLDYEATWIDWTTEPPAMPTSKYALDVREHGDGLLVSHGNGLVRYGFPASGIPRATWMIRVACPGRGCPALIEGDYDSTCDRWAVTDEYGVMSCMGGDVLWQWDSGRPVNIHLVESPGNGAVLFARGSHQYLVANGWPDLCGTGTRDARPALLRLTSTSTWDVLQCIDPPPSAASPELPALPELPAPAGATPERAVSGSLTVTDGVDLGGYVYLLSVRNGYAYSYRVSGSGSGLRLTYAAAAPRMISRWGRSWALDGDVLLTSLPPTAPDQSGLWDISDPSRPRLLASLDVPYQGRVALGSGVAAVFSLDEFRAYDVRDPASPRLIAAGVVPDLPGDVTPWAYDRQHHLGGAVRGSRLYLADYTVGVSLVVDLEQCGKPAAIFSDGFESGDTSAWSETIGHLTKAKLSKHPDMVRSTLSSSTVRECSIANFSSAALAWRSSGYQAE